ncbi:MAG TPA: type II secretion system F family protein [Candidatus Xenobia bacterium]|jgi:type IV pilus assembly protein PilC
MLEFLYVAKNQQGERVSGEIEGLSQEKVVARLRDQNLTIIRLDPVKPRPWIWYLLEPIKPSLLVLFIREMAVMLNAGVNIMRVLTVLTQHPGPPRFRKAVNRLMVDVSSGYSLSQAMLRHPEYFSPFLVGSVRVGEATGRLPQTLDSCASYQEREYEYGLKLKNACIYPIVLLSVCGLVVSFIFKYMIPSFVSLFVDLSMELPWPTQVLVDAEKFANTILPVMLATVAGPALACGFFFWRYSRTPRARWRWEWLLLRLPWYGRQVKYRMLAKYFRSFATLMAAGVRVTTSLELLARSMDKEILVRSARSQLDSVRHGLTITQGMRMIGFFPPMAVEMIFVGEETGKLDSILQRLSNYFDEEMIRGLDTINKLIEPVVLFILGGVVGFILLAAFLPIYKLAASF